jgi:hypothetical protein
MEDQLLEMHLATTRISVPCMGWRPNKVESWLDAVDAHVLFDLGFGGIVTGRDYYNAKVRHLRDGQSYDAFIVAHPDGISECDAQAAALEEKCGGL